MDIMAFAIIVIQLAFIMGSEYFHRREREKLIKAILAKDLKDLTENEREEKFRPTPPSKLPSDFVPVEDADPDIFDDMIGKVRS